MTKDKKEPVVGGCEEWFYLSLYEVTTSFGISTEKVKEIVDEGIVSIQKNEKDEWEFDNEAVRRIATTLRLDRDLGINLAGAALVLELLKEIDRLHALLQR